MVHKRIAANSTKGCSIERQFTELFVRLIMIQAY